MAHRDGDRQVPRGGARAAGVVVALSTVLGLAAAHGAAAQGFANEPQIPGELLSGLNAPTQGRTAIIAYHNGVLVTVPEVPSSQPGADFQVRTWDLADPRAPVETATLGVTPMPINAHGYFKSGEYLVLGSNWPPESPWSFVPDGPGALQRTEYPDLLCAGVRGCLFQPWFAGDTYWSYGEVAGDAFLELRGERLATWDHLGETGVIGHPFILGDLLIFAADQTRTGVATYDIGDPANPVLLDVLTDGGPGGYWPELWGGDGRLYAVFPYRTGGNGFRVVDLTDPTDLRFVTDRPLPGTEVMYAQFQDHYAFMGDHKVDMRTFESVLFLDGANVSRTNDGGIGVDTSQFALPLGNLLVTGGIGPNEGMAVWAHQAEPDTRGPTVGFHVPRTGRTGYPVTAPVSLLIHETLDTTTIVNGETFIVRPVGGAPVAGRLTFAFDDVLTFTPDAPLSPDTSYEVLLPGGGIRDAAGNGIEEHTFTFSTGASLQGNAPPQVHALTVSTYPAAPGQSLQLEASASDPEGETIDYRFDAGDGSPRSAWSGSDTWPVSYADPGHYRASVQARDATGAIATAVATVTVLEPAAGPAPRASGPLACDAEARRVLVVNPDNGTVAAVDADTLEKLWEVPACPDPRAVVATGTGELWVSCHDADTLRILDAATGAAVGGIFTGYGSAPFGIALDPAGTTAYVTLTGDGSVQRYDVATRALFGSVSLGPTPRAIAVSADGMRALVTRFLSPEDHAQVWEVDTTTMTLARTLEIPKIGDEDNRDGTASGRGVANYLAAIAIAPDGASAWVAATKANTERGLLFGPDLDQDNTVRNLAVQIDLASGTTAHTLDLDNSDSASGLAFSPFGDYLLVTLQGNNEVLVIDALEVDAASGLGSSVTRLGAGRAPQGACVDPSTGRTFVKNLMSRDLTVLETDALFAAGSVAPPSAAVSTVAAESLPPGVLRGKQIFYDAGDPRMSAEGYLSCATCHLDGGHDGRVWDFTGRGEGLRNTTSLRGRMGTGQGNVHWSGNFDEIQDFENDIRSAFGGSGFLSDADHTLTADPLGPPKAGLSADSDALAAYVSSLGPVHVPRSPHRRANGTITDEGLVGVQVFTALGCGGCHTGAMLTDSTLGTATLHDVGTLRSTSGGRLGGVLEGLDTPTLTGVWSTAPYFHDGSAATLDEVFRVAGGTVLPAEDGVTSAGAYPVTEYVELNNDDTVHGRALVALGTTGARLTFTAVDGGAGGEGALELRYSASRAQPLVVTINGAEQVLDLEALPNAPSWRHTHWGRARLEDIRLEAGLTNTIEISTTETWPDVSVDEVTVTTADELALAVHRLPDALPPALRGALLAFLRQLDGRPLRP